MTSGPVGCVFFPGEYDLQRSAIIPLWICLVVGVAGCSRAPEEIALSGPAQGTVYNVKVATPPAGVDAHAVRVAIDAVLDSVDRSMSGYRPDSEVSRFNASTGTDWFPVSADLATVVAASQEVSEASQGAFDITVAPLVALWGFGPDGEPAQLPDAAAIREVQTHTGYRLLEVRREPAALRKKDGRLTVDLNGAAPGFTVDKLAQRFLDLGVRHFMIDIGGEVLARGRNAQGQPWHIAVEKPSDARSEPYVILKLADMSVTTSGEYRHYYSRDGRRYSHTIDPRTASPVQHDLAAVVVMGTTSLAIDCWSTALNVLGGKEGYDLATERGIPAMFIVQDGERLEKKMTPGFAGHVIEAPSP